ncbi:Transcriptional regulatory protein YpdB [Bacillus sp. THAF10]|uniref:LytR/AlgR family response regulator transcription factor n=1 Tax=Bacillus sp. THAF10 TaxID=2587848 RepID=UPI001268BA4C|nr:LytTR family DNA-binding domain-containing protein [Bacillus sp. THAF10]QFT89271.1 Transcriptional regulatory protein YpdB [Bacillus sp. THAF10]
MTRIKTIIVDDERYSRDELKHLLQEYDHINVVGEAASGEDALVLCMQQLPAVVFLDIEMPKMSGLEVAKHLKELKNPPLIVFATAYPDFALEAFRHEAIDYLLKPYEEEQVNETIQRMIKYLQPNQYMPVSTSNAKLAVELEHEIFYLDPLEILYISREERVSRIFTKDGHYESKLALKELEERLSSYPFFRIHKSYIVNLNHVSKLIPWFNGAYMLELAGSKEKLSVSRNYVKSLRSKLEL